MQRERFLYESTLKENLFVRVRQTSVIRNNELQAKVAEAEASDERVEEQSRSDARIKIRTSLVRTLFHIRIRTR